MALGEVARFSDWILVEEKRLLRLELVPLSQSGGLEVFSDVSPCASWTGGDTEVVTDADFAEYRVEEVNNLCTFLL